MIARTELSRAIQYLYIHGIHEAEPGERFIYIHYLYCDQLDKPEMYLDTNTIQNNTHMHGTHQHYYIIYNV